MQEHEAVQRLEFLPYHFLLSSVGNHGVLRYQVTAFSGMHALSPYQPSSGISRI